MSNSKVLILFTYLLSTHIIFSQEYITYSDENYPHHTLIISDKQIIVKIFQKNSFFLKSQAKYYTVTKMDTILVTKKLKSNLKGIEVSNTFFDSFQMTKILKKSKIELLLLGKNRPYVEKKLIDSINR